jgi:hypothetical protein
MEAIDQRWKLSIKDGSYRSKILKLSIKDGSYRSKILKLSIKDGSYRSKMEAIDQRWKLSIDIVVDGGALAGLSHMTTTAMMRQDRVSTRCYVSMSKNRSAWMEGYIYIGMCVCVHAQARSSLEWPMASVSIGCPITI